MATKLDIPKHVCDSVNSYLLTHQTLNPSRMGVQDVVNAINRLRGHTFRSREAGSTRRPVKPNSRLGRKVYRLMGKLLVLLSEAGCNVVTAKDTTGNYHTYINQ